MKKWVYSFGDEQVEGTAKDHNLLGGKGANLAEMCNLGLPVPPGFTLTTQVCTYFYNHQRHYPMDLEKKVNQAIIKITQQTKRIFGDKIKPLLLSVRSGARVSMPGMMDTILNLGLNDQTVKAIAEESQDERFAYDCYRRFIQMYSDVVLGIDYAHFEDILDGVKARFGYDVETQFTAHDWKNVIQDFKSYIEYEWGKPFPQDPAQQLWGAIEAVFSSWMTPRAMTYRRLHSIPEDWGSAVTIQAMVFGNMGDNSATGVAFTRNPSTGDHELYGEFLINAQGEDVVSGIRTPQNITESAQIAAGSNEPSLEKLMPEAFSTLRSIADTLERHYCDMQDIEFTIEKGKVWMLQTRVGKRTALAALKIAVEMVKSGLITKDEAILRVDPKSFDQLVHPTLDPDAPKTILAIGLPASPGIATGEIIFTSEEAEKALLEGRKVILVRKEINPEDIHGMHGAQGVLTLYGGMTSHAAVVARDMGKPCVSGAAFVRIDEKAGVLTAAGEQFVKGDILTINGANGHIYKGHVATMTAERSDDFATLMEWAAEKF
ncbi:pyruvate, phosphate dikinase [Bartonella tamiae Th307]|uniref:Pyruvate, phosphate dikinase n=1 Tax=Bartonella tamiae Th239 TaxID=1094558 RepID=J0QWY9_9HYPH|nr:pyruvate, phosphate dikinase [Bartonella tamiae]EJF90551.1 pyruvate, phosphate dikinase [Bartonella tamiae Th239]EJF94071.1 pyruvate, phosphate dikinase [Bartonella tamiae Th307]